MKKSSLDKKISKSDNIDKSDLYFVYIIECENNILYTGVTTDYKRRFAEHSKVDGSKKGAKFTKSHKPVKIVALWKAKGRSAAQKLEARIKKLSKIEKLDLIKDDKSFKFYFDEYLNCKEYKRGKI